MKTTYSLLLCLAFASPARCEIPTDQLKLIHIDRVIALTGGPPRDLHAYGYPAFERAPQPAYSWWGHRAIAQYNTSAYRRLWAQPAQRRVYRNCLDPATQDQAYWRQQHDIESVYRQVKQLELQVEMRNLQSIPSIGR